MCADVYIERVLSKQDKELRENNNTMEHEYIHSSNDYLQYLTDLSEFAGLNLQTLAGQGELIIKNLENIAYYILEKCYSDSSMESNKKVTEVEVNFLNIPNPTRDEYYNRLLSILKEKTDESVSTKDRLQTAVQYVFRKTKNTLYDSYILSVCMFIVKNNHLPMASIDSLNKIPFIPDMKITVEQLYETLKIMRNESQALGLIKLISCPNAIWDILIESFKMNRKKKFIQTIYDNDCDLTSIQKVCYVNQKLEHLLFLYQQKIKLSSDILPMEDPPQEEKATHIIQYEIQKYENTVLEPLLYALFGVNLKSVDPEKKEYKAYNMYLILRNHLSNDELEYTQVEKICSQFLQRKETVIISPQPSSGMDIPFQLPDDYFELDLYSDHDAYFCKLKEYVKTGGGAKFMEFINWLAEDKYIEDTSETKSTFAFRLTGICSPPNPLEKIEWKEKAAYLFYIIRYFYRKDDCKAKKIVKFFCCKDEQFKNVASFSSYAKRGEKVTKDPFLQKIRQFYPDIEK